MDYTELTLIDSTTQVEELFHECLRRRISKGNLLTDDELVYVAKLLAGRTKATSNFEVPAEMLVFYRQVYERPKTERELEHHLGISHAAGDQCLFCAGFFRARTVQEKTTAIYDELGSQFYKTASELAQTHARRGLMMKMSQNFPIWTRVCHKLRLSLGKDYKPVLH